GWLSTAPSKVRKTSGLKALSNAGALCAEEFTKISAVTHSIQRLALLCNHMDQSTSMPVCYSFQSSVFCSPTIQGFEARLRPSNNIYWRTALPGAITPRTPKTAYLQAEGAFSPATFGSHVA